MSREDWCSCRCVDRCTEAGRTFAHVAVRTGVQEQGGLVLMSLCGLVYRSREDWCSCGCED